MSTNTIANIKRLAKELYAARQMHASNQAFGVWLAENELDDVGKTDRAALIGIGGYPGVCVAMLEDTGLQSPRLIWEAMESKPSSLAGEHGSTRTSPTETEESALPAANSANPPAETEPKVSGTMSEAAPVES